MISINEQLGAHRTICPAAELPLTSLANFVHFNHHPDPILWVT